MSKTPQRPDKSATPIPWEGVTLLRASMEGTEADKDLRIAVILRKLEDVKQILEEGQADVNYKDEEGLTPVMEAAVRGHVDVVELLASKGANFSLKTADGDTLLHMACRRGDVETVKFLFLQPGVDIDARNNRGQTAADVAKEEKHLLVMCLPEFKCIP